jgi:hypothetical protein
MKRLLLTLTLLTLATGAHAQLGNAVVIPFVGVPSGSCSVIMFAINTSNGDFYDCNSGSWLKVSGGGGGSGTVSANNTAAGAVANYAAAAGSTTVGPTTLNYVAPTLTVSTAAGGNGVLALSGNTSGTATLTAPAVAGTITNAITVSNSLSTAANAQFLGAGAGASAPTFASSGNPNSGMQVNANGEFFSGSGVYQLSVQTAGGTGAGRGAGFASDGVLLWTSANGSSVPGIGTVDTGISRGAAGVVDVGTGASANSAGTLKALAYQTDTNCSATGTAANPSVASCGSSTAGSFSCATNASTGTCVVNTTSVTANSEIFITQRSDTTTGTRLGVTCNATLSTVITEITAVTAATSFTINLGTITTNPECFSYHIVN